MSHTHHVIVQEIQSLASVTPDHAARFFKTAPGEYAAHDQFLGVTVPTLRAHAKGYVDLPLEDVHALLQSPFNEVRLFAAIILTTQYDKAAPADRQVLFDFYRAHMDRMNNWNLVDASAHLIVGRHLFEGGVSGAELTNIPVLVQDDDKSNKGRAAQCTPSYMSSGEPEGQRPQRLKYDGYALLATLVASNTMWERRIGIVATWWFIRQNDVGETFHLAVMLLQDRHDLMHKATGWMLREAGKRDLAALRAFLDQHAHTMPRTMLRYAIERMDAEERKSWLSIRSL
jgi:3-methyladenine DNA glycosylase AlkD